LGIDRIHPGKPFRPGRPASTQGPQGTFALDDFGSGFSSLAYLDRFPVDVIKIGPNFVAELGTEPDHATLLTAIVSLGHSLGLTVVAEGVETAEQLAVLQDTGCDLVQGFHFAPPHPADQIPTLLAPAPQPAPGTPKTG
jgi:EAL domain-containing protein (putative c-di-GMP-specific phosphodiesterase class I)